MHLSARFEHSLLAVESEHDVHCMLEITSPAAPGADTRTPLDLALVIDRSGSMFGRKLEVTKDCAAFLARRLAPTDRIALVTYDDEVRLMAPLANPTSALAVAIASIVPGGQTNLSGGWMKGLEVLGAADERGAISLDTHLSRRRRRLAGQETLSSSVLGPQPDLLFPRQPFESFLVEVVGDVCVLDR